jgi:PIN domain nuclease of toxin-antitoxin system
MTRSAVRRRNRLEDAGNRKLVSIASYWEIAIKAGLGKLKLGEPTSTLLDRELARNCFDLLQISLAHATAVEALPLHHKDPFDRLLVAQSLAETTPVVSHDPLLDSYGIVRIW